MILAHVTVRCVSQMVVSVQAPYSLGEREANYRNWLSTLWEKGGKLPQLALYSLGEGRQTTATGSLLFGRREVNYRNWLSTLWEKGGKLPQLALYSLGERHAGTEKANYHNWFLQLLYLQQRSFATVLGGLLLVHLVTNNIQCGHTMACLAGLTGLTSCSPPLFSLAY